MKICDLDLNETQKKVLSLTITPRTAYEIAAKLKKSYSSINQNLGILIALKYVRKIDKMKNGVVYQLDTKQVQP